MEKSDVLEVFRTSLKEVPEELAKITKTDNQLNALGYLYYYSPAINHYSLGVRRSGKKNSEPFPKWYRDEQYTELFIFLEPRLIRAKQILNVCDASSRERCKRHLLTYFKDGLGLKNSHLALYAYTILQPEYESSHKISDFFSFEKIYRGRRLSGRTLVEPGYCWRIGFYLEPMDDLDEFIEFLQENKEIIEEDLRGEASDVMLTTKNLQELVMRFLCYAGFDNKQIEKICDFLFDEEKGLFYGKLKNITSPEISHYRSLLQKSLRNDWFDHVNSSIDWNLSKDKLNNFKLDFDADKKRFFLR